eukprot:CAMPEP_0176487204 /NCGR_PEP_ID=MMETSP0200_2-20121128/5994_1 /TAXON_ID=947934 /ORGANISM="Chaetoceros sp., Strain GSL56" /LENGTH=633 /DNA_ID=CAMNT_0017883991 /DNA_START=71 /DNA_END=1969 /DNA_ORIENTATION=+
MTVSLFASLSKTKALSNNNGGADKGIQQNQQQQQQGGESSGSTSITAALSSPVPPPPAFPPAIVQLYSSKFIDLNQSSIIQTGDPQSCLIAPLSYQSVNASTTSASAAAAATTTTSSTSSTTPTNNMYLASDFNFGIWNCHIVVSNKSNQHITTTTTTTTTTTNHTTTTPSKLLQACHPIDCDKKPLLAGETGTNSMIPIFVIALDLDYDNLVNVHGMMETVVGNIIQYCRTYNPPKDSRSGYGNGGGRGRGNGTTRLQVLCHAKFGKAPLTEDDDGDDDGDCEREKEKEGEGEGKERGKGKSDGVNLVAEEHTSTTTTTGNSTITTDVYIHLVICGILCSKKDVTYREKQALNLVSYHLQKFASEVNCTLCFMRNDDVVVDDERVSGGGGGEGLNHGKDVMGHHPVTVVREDGFRPKGLSVAEFAKCLSKVILYQSSNRNRNNNTNDENKVVGREEDFDADDILTSTNDNNLNNDNNGGYQQPSFYGPFDYDVDLINSVLLRGAGCPGVWNANTDSLWVALQPPPLSQPLQNSDDSIIGNNASSMQSSKDGDQEWLEKLAESVNVYAGTMGAGSASGGDGKSVKSSMDQTVRTARTLGNNTVVTKKKVVKKKPSATGDSKGDTQDVQDFFAG